MFLVPDPRKPVFAAVCRCGVDPSIVVITTHQSRNSYASSPMRPSIPNPFLTLQKFQPAALVLAGKGGKPAVGFSSARIESSSPRQVSVVSP